MLPSPPWSRKLLDLKNVLVLEDEPIIGFALEDMLIDLGYSAVLVATRLDEAKGYIEAAQVDAAILDVNIHGQRSYPIADLLCERRLPYIFASGYGDTEHPERHRLAPTVTKPYSTQDIQAALESAYKSLTPTSSNGL